MAAAAGSPSRKRPGSDGWLGGVDGGFFYYVDERAKTIWIVDVWHGAQLTSAPELPQHIAE